MSRIGVGICAYSDDPRWSQTCPNGHFHSVRAEERPTNCPTCGKEYDPPRGAGGIRIRHSGQGALATRGDGWSRRHPA